MCIRRFFSCTYSICPPGEDPNKAGYVRISTYITQHYYIQVVHTHTQREREYSNSTQQINLFPLYACKHYNRTWRYVRTPHLPMVYLYSCCPIRFRLGNRQVSEEEDESLGMSTWIAMLRWCSLDVAAIEPWF